MTTAHHDDKKISGKRSKPSTSEAMHGLITRAREYFPFQDPATSLCHDNCRGCAKKLLSYLESEIDAWDSALSEKNAPKLGDIQHLSRLALKIDKALKNHAMLR